MIVINSLKDVNEYLSESEGLRKEIQKYIRGLAESITGQKEIEEFNLEEVGSILVIEDGDSVKELEQFGIVIEGEEIPILIPEFVDRVKAGESEIMRIVWVCGDCFGFTVYYAPKTFSEEFDRWLEKHAID